MSKQLCLLVVVVLAIPGCGESGPTVKAGGKVTVNGQPTEGLNVVFTPEKGRPAVGVTDAQGNFRLSTFEAADGAVPGSHTVTITEATPPPDGEPNYDVTPPSTKVSSKYAIAQTSGLTATVKTGEKNEFEFDLEK